MTQTHSKSRQQAEIAFGKAQLQFFARNSAVEELDSLILPRAEKTLRLREARQAKELQDRLIVSAALVANTPGKSDADKGYRDTRADLRGAVCMSGQSNAASETSFSQKFYGREFMQVLIYMMLRSRVRAMMRVSPAPIGQYHEYPNMD